MKTGLKIKKPAMAYTVICAAFLWIFALSLIFLFAYAFVNSVKGIFDYIENPLGLPEKWEWGNYLLIWEYFYTKIGSSGPIYYLEHMFAFGFLYAAGCAAASTAVSALTAYATAQFDYKFSKIVYALVLFTMACPIIGAQASELQMVKTLGIYDTFIGCFILKSNFLSMYYLVLFALFKGIPKEFDEAARIDGAGTFTIFFKIMLPFARNTIFTIMLLHFISYWNDYQTPLLYLPSYPTIAYGLFKFSFSTIPDIAGNHIKLGGCLVVALPIFVVYMIFQNRLIGNISLGGIKE